MSARNRKVERELAAAEALLNAMPELRRGTLRGADRPDVRMLVPGAEIGIEHTELSFDHELLRAEHEIGSVFAEARKMALGALPLTLDAAVAVRDDARPAKRDRRTHAARLVALIAREVPFVADDGRMHKFHSPADPLAERVYLRHVPSYRRPFIGPFSVGIAASGIRSHVEACIAGKDALRADYEACAEFWLLIVVPDECRANFADESEFPKLGSFRSGFNRAFIMGRLSGAVAELTLERPD